MLECSGFISYSLSLNMNDIFSLLSQCAHPTGLQTSLSPALPSLSSNLDDEIVEQDGPCREQLC